MMTHRDATETLLRQQKALAEFGELALTCDDLDEILTHACRLVARALCTHLAKVMELQEDGITLLVRAGVGWPDGIVGRTTVKAERGSSEGFALRTGKPVISRDIATEKRFQYADFVKNSGVRALVNVIIIGAKGKKPYGVLQVDAREPRDFDESDTEFLRSYANLIAAAVERLRTVSELQEREKYYRALTEHNPQIPWMADAEGQLCVIDPRWTRLTGLTESETLEKSLLHAVHPDDREDLEARWHDARKRKTSYEAQVRLETARKSFKWFRIQGHPSVTKDGGVSTWYGTIENIQERHQLEDALREWAQTLEVRVAERTAALEAEQRERMVTEEQLRQSQKMEAVGQLTGGLAHDFNNLLAGISGGLELIRARLQQHRIDDLEKFITAALSSTQRAAALTHRLLAFSRRQTLEPRAVDTNQLINGLADMIQRTVGPSVEITTTLSASQQPIRCDPNQLENAILNLALNARDAMPDGGQLTIGTANITLDSAQAQRHDVAPGRYVRVSVTDTGIGMTPDVVARAFDPFFTTKPLGAGTGLGLSMIYGFAKQSGGQARIHSVPDVGTTISIYLPVFVGDDDILPLHSMEGPLPLAKYGGTILLVDDEPVVRLTSAEFLRDLGYEVIEAPDARSALHILDASDIPITCLISDIGLPGGMNGRQLADAARVARPQLKVLFITGFADAAVVGHRALDAGMHVLTKPFSMETFGTRVCELHD